VNPWIPVPVTEVEERHKEHLGVPDIALEQLDFGKAKVDACEEGSCPYVSVEYQHTP
jgi:hypothetical protein